MSTLQASAKLPEKAARKQLQSYLESVNPNQMTPTASLLLPAPPFVSISDVRRLQFLPRGRRRPLLCWSGAEWGSVRTQMLSSFIGKSDLWMDCSGCGVLSFFADSNLSPPHALVGEPRWFCLSLACKCREQKIEPQKRYLRFPVWSWSPRSIGHWSGRLVGVRPQGSSRGESAYTTLPALFLLFLGLFYSLLLCLRGARNWETLTSGRQDWLRYRTLSILKFELR